jgi:hypothetical protein
MITALTVLLAGCATGRAHENFLSYMQRQVGRSADDPNVPFNRYRQNRGAITTLANGNIQQQYLFGPGCDVYFEIAKGPQTIVAWRYDGTKDTCYLVP